MTSEFQNYVPIQGLQGAVSGIAQAEERLSESSLTIDPNAITESMSESSQMASIETATETISESPVVTIT